VLENRSAAVNAPSPLRTPRAEPPSKLRARRTNDPWAGIDRNTAAGRRIADLLRAFLRQMGNPTDAVSTADALRAAELVVASEQARAKLLAGEGDADMVVRLEGASDRAIRRLGIKAGKPDATPRLRDYLAEAADRHAADEAAS
jgi:hypothetical protein